jgi:hypothetical protein
MDAVEAEETYMLVALRGNLADVIRDSMRLHPQFRFAAAKALTDVVGMVRAAMPSELESALDKPTQFTKGGFYIKPARKDNLEASVGVKDRQAEYLQYQIDGGERAPKKVALRLPAVVELDGAGNLPAGTIKRLVQRAQAGRRATKAQGKRFGVSTQVDLFYGEPGDGRPAGIYKRVPIGEGRTRLVPIVVFPKRSAHYTRRFDFEGVAERIVSRNFSVALDNAWAQALATAR